MKQVTRCLTINNKDFYLVQVEESDFKPTINEETKKMMVGQYGTIPYEWVDDNGRLNRKITFFDVCVAETIERAIQRRKDAMYMEQFKDLPDEQFIKKLMEYEKSKMANA